MEKKYKTALILSSGALKGSYQCGVLKALREHNMEFDVIVGSSAGAYNGVRYLADQMDICESVYVVDSSGRKLIKPWNLLVPGRSFLDLDYLVDEVCHADYKPIDMDKVRASKSDFYITALEYDTMETRFFNAKENDIHALLKATAAIPLLYSGEVIIDGKRYLDGGMLEPIPIGKAIDMGCAELCVVLNRVPGDEKPYLLKRLIVKMPGWMPRLIAEHNRIRREINEFLYQPHDGISLTIIRPQQPMPIGRFSSDADKLQFCIDTGYRDGQEFIKNGGSGR